MIDYKKMIGKQRDNILIIGMGDKINYHQYMKCKCVKCGIEFEVYAGHFRRGQISTYRCKCNPNYKKHVRSWRV